MTSSKPITVSVFSEGVSVRYVKFNVNYVGLNTLLPHVSGEAEKASLLAR